MGEAKAIQFVRKAIDAGCFGTDRLIDIVPDDLQGQDQFASCVVFLKVKFQDKFDVDEELVVNVIVKMKDEDAFFQQYINTDAQFHNEALMYEEILPFLNVDGIVQDIFPDNYYSNTSDEKDSDVVIIENLSHFGFRLTDERIHLDYEHCVLALRDLGRFHALSYAAKQRNFSAFKDKVSKLKEVRYREKTKDSMITFCRQAVMRGITPLLGENEYKEVLESFLGKINEHYTFLKYLISPEEPVSVVCHGDFCRNNILYKYENNKPLFVKFFDLATTRYASPAIDISFFLLLNVPTQIRSKRWDDLLKIYHDSLSSAVPGTVVPTLEDVKGEMRKKAVYGYIVSSLFAYYMIGDLKVEQTEWLISLPQSEFDGIFLTNGGEQVTQYLVGMIKDLILKNCL